MFLQYGKFGNDLLTSCLTNKLFVVEQFLDKNFPLYSIFFAIIFGSIVYIWFNTGC